MVKISPHKVFTIAAIAEGSLVKDCRMHRKLSGEPILQYELRHQKRQQIPVLRLRRVIMQSPCFQVLAIVVTVAAGSRWWRRRRLLCCVESPGCGVQREVGQATRKRKSTSTITTRLQGSQGGSRPKDLATTLHLALLFQPTSASQTPNHQHCNQCGHQRRPVAGSPLVCRQPR